MIRVEAAPNRKLLALYLVWFLVWVGVTAVGANLTPSPRGHGTHRQLGLPPCPSVLFTGRPCPGCGLTTSFSATVQGDLSKAMRVHPFGPWLYAAFTISAWITLYGFVRQRYVELTRVGYWIMGVFVMAYMGFGIVRYFNPPPWYAAASHAERVQSEQSR